MRQNAQARTRFFGMMESLERRALLASISGVVMEDLSGNGLSADDTPMSGVVVKLFNDVDGNGLLDAADGASIAAATSAADGTFAFAGLAIGKYLVQDKPSNDYVRTAPTLQDFVAVNVAQQNGTYDDIFFANYVKDFDWSAVSNISYTINGTTTVTDMSRKVQQGDTVTATFTVAAGKSVELSLVSYKAIGGDFDPEDAQFQEIFDLDTGVFGEGTHTLTITVPDCFFQVDFVGGKAINPFGPAGSNTLYSVQDRLIDHANGGDGDCGCGCEETGGEGLTPGYWKNHVEQWAGYTPNQTLESVFDVPDALGLDGKTLLEALNFGGGGGVLGAAKNLFRQAVAGLLNASHTLVEYAITSSAIINQVNSALASNDKSVIEDLKDDLDDYNNAGGGIDAHGNAI